MELYREVKYLAPLNFENDLKFSGPNKNTGSIIIDWENIRGTQTC